MKNSADLRGCYPPWLSASVDNTLLDLLDRQNSSYPTQPHSIIAKSIVSYSSISISLLQSDFLYAKNLDQGKYKLLVNDMGEISQDVGYEMLVCNNDKIVPVTEIPNTDL